MAPAVAHTAGNFKAGRFALISADEMIIAHTNETEYRSFIADKKNEALHSRDDCYASSHTI